MKNLHGKKIRTAEKKVAIVYDRVNKWGGAERVLLALHRVYPKAPLYTSIYDPKKAPWAKVFPKVYTSFLQKWPFVKSNHEFFAILMPFAFAGFNFKKYNLVISVTSETAKGIKVEGKTKHICYCLTPTRYLWSGYKNYFNWLPLKIAGYPFVKILQMWDKHVAKKPEVMVAISTEVQKRILRYYKRNSIIVYPPVDIQNTKFKSRVNPNRQKDKKYYLLVSRLDFGYKKVDLAIRAFNKLGTPLIIVGAGREEGKLRKMAGKNIIFTGKVDDKSLINFYKHAKALIMPQEEDFGIVSVEAQSFGVPVIAFGKGGATDTVISGKTGVFFGRQTPGSLIKAVKKFEKMRFNRKRLLTNAKRFSFGNFRRSILALTAK